MSDLETTNSLKGRVIICIFVCYQMRLACRLADSAWRFIGLGMASPATFMANADVSSYASIDFGYSCATLVNMSQHLHPYC